jgi:hypothetical protein
MARPCLRKAMAPGGIADYVWLFTHHMKRNGDCSTWLTVVLGWRPRSENGFAPTAPHYPLSGKQRMSRRIAGTAKR